LYRETVERSESEPDLELEPEEVSTGDEKKETELENTRAV